MTMLRNNSLFVDTSGWASYLGSQDPFHKEVDIYVQRALASQRRLVTTNYVITELVVLLSSRYHLPRKQVIAAINIIKKDSFMEVIYIGQDVDDEAWQLLETRLDKEWSLVDATSFVVMNRLGITDALTSDHHFIQAGFRRVPDITR